MSLDVYLNINGEEVYFANITHNLGKMASEGGIYEALWRPEEIGITHAKQLVEPLRVALVAMLDDPERFEAHNSPNGWGMFEHFEPFVRKYWRACKQFPDAIIEVSR